MRKLLALGLVLILFVFYWTLIRPSNIRQFCYETKLQIIKDRHSENLNYYFVGGGVPDFEKDIDADRNKPMYVNDLNSRLDEEWGEIGYNNCLKKNGLQK